MGTSMPSMKNPTFAGGAPRTKNDGTPDTMGTTPGCASTARSGSPNAPGMLRTSLEVMVTVPGACLTPWMTTSVGWFAGAGAGEAAAPASGGAPAGGAASAGSRDGSKRSV
jgi:hypothetical protein